jgi:hypothetical protein
MNPDPFKHREIVETERFAEELAALENRRVEMDLDEFLRRFAPLTAGAAVST